MYAKGHPANDYACALNLARAFYSILFTTGCIIFNLLVRNTVFFDSDESIIEHLALPAAWSLALKGGSISFNVIAEYIRSAFQFKEHCSSISDEDILGLYLSEDYYLSFSLSQVALLSTIQSGVQSYFVPDEVCSGFRPR